MAQKKKKPPKRGPGRPKLDDGLTRTVAIKFRGSELERVTELAREYGETPGQWIRRNALAALGN